MKRGRAAFMGATLEPYVPSFDSQDTVFAHCTTTQFSGKLSNG